MEIDQVRILLIEEMASSMIEKLARSAIQEMKRMRWALLSGDDSGLKNLWEEYVAQIRGSESIYFEEYLEAVSSYCLNEVNKLSRTEKFIIILGFDHNSTEFEEWQTDAENATSYQDVCPNNELVTSAVVHCINKIAEEYTSIRLERYLNNFDEEE